MTEKTPDNQQVISRGQIATSQQQPRWYPWPQRYKSSHIGKKIPETVLMDIGAVSFQMDMI